MRLYHKLPLLALLLLSGRVYAQPAAPPVPPEQDVDDDEQPQAIQAQDGMPPPDPNAYAQQAPQYGYMGPHPIPYEAGQGFCYQQGPHFHEYAPFDQYLFREQGGWFYFVGDAADFGYSMQMWGYNGHHPIPAAYGGGWCFIDWPHRHHYAPPPAVAFNFVGGYYVYGGPYDPWYWRWRSHYVGYYGGYYRRSYYGGVYWRVRPAPVYRPHIVVGAPGYYRPGAVVVAPGGARVHVGPPMRAGVVVGAPRPMGPRPGVVVGAPGPRAGVVVGAPRPYAPAPRGGVVVGAPAPHGYAPARPVGAPHPMAPAPRVVAPPRAAPARVAAPPAHSGGGGGHRR
jgi:hypothetical protein